MTDEWIPISLGSVCLKIGSGATPRGGSNVYLDCGKITLIRSQNVYNNGFHHEGLVFITHDHAKDLDNVEVMPGDVLLNITGDSVARCCQVDISVLPARVNQHVAIIRPDPQKLDPCFLRYYLISPLMQAQMLSWARSGGTRNALTKGMIESFEVIAPADVSDQRAIARILGTLDDKIELNRRMNETLEAMVRALFKSWFVDFDPVRAKAEGREPAGMDAETAALFPDSFEETELGEVPKGWEVKTVGDVLELAYGKALKEENRIKGDIPVFGSNGQVGWHSEKLVDGPGIIVGRKGNPGVVTWSSKDFFPIDTTFYVILKGLCKSMYYVFYSLQQQELASLGADSAVPGLNRNLAYMSQMIIPSSNILELFDKQASILTFFTHVNKEQSLTLSTIRDLLLPKLLSGQIPIKDAEQWMRHAR